MSDADQGCFISKVTSRVVGDKRRWREYKARAGQLPPTYRAAIDAIERHLFLFGPTDSESAASLFEDVADLFERVEAWVVPDVVRADAISDRGGPHRGVLTRICWLWSGLEG